MKHSRFYVAIFASLTLALAAGCATTYEPSRSDKRTDPQGDLSQLENVSPQERADFQSIQLVFNSKLYDTALSRIAAFEKKFPRSALLAQTGNLKGLIYLSQKKLPQAQATFEKTLGIAAKVQPALVPYLEYNLATVLFEQNRIQDAQTLAARIRKDDVNADNQFKIFVLQSRIELKLGKGFNALEHALSASKLTADPTTLNPLIESSLKLLDGSPETLDRLANLVREHESSPAAELPLFHLGSARLKAGAKEEARESLQSFVGRFPKSAMAPTAASLLAQLGAPAVSTPVATSEPARPGNYPFDSKSVGVLLPMTGKFARFGQKTLQGLEMAFGTFEGSDYTLFVEDSGEDGETAVRALDKLVMQSRCALIIGPLLSKGIERVTERAAALGVPLLSLSRNAGTPSDYIVQAGLSTKLQSYSIAKHAIENLGLHRFAVAFPGDKTGHQFAQDFWAGVEHFGGQVTGYEYYAPTESDYRQVVDKLTGLYYTEARAPELAVLARERDNLKIKKLTRKTERYFRLPPIVDFDAVFIPEEPKASSQLIPTFAYRDVERVQFLGTASWNTLDFLERAQNSAEGAVFVDAYAADAKGHPATAQFIAHFQRTFPGAVPSGVEALAYDAGRVARQALDTRPSDRPDTLKAIKGIQNFDGVTGTIRYDSGLLMRDLRAFTVKGGRIVTLAN